MVLQAMMCGLIAQSKQEVIFSVMPRTKELARLCDELFQAGDVFIRNLNGLFAFTNHVNHVGQRLTRRIDLHLAVHCPSDQRRVLQSSKGNGLKVYGTARLLRWGKR